MAPVLRILTKTEMENKFGPNWRTNSIKVNTGNGVVSVPFSMDFDFLLGSELAPRVLKFFRQNPNRAYLFRVRGRDFTITQEVTTLFPAGLYPANNVGGKWKKAKVDDFMSAWAEAPLYSELEYDELYHAKMYNFNINKLLEED